MPPTASVRAAGFEVISEPRRKPKHFEIVGRRDGALSNCTSHSTGASDTPSRSAPTTGISGLKLPMRVGERPVAVRRSTAAKRPPSRWCLEFLYGKGNVMKPASSSSHHSGRTSGALQSLNFFMADMQAGIGPFLGVFLLAHGWESGLIGTVMTRRCRSSRRRRPPRDAIDDKAARGLNDDGKEGGKPSGFRVLLDCKPLLILAAALA